MRTIETKVFQYSELSDKAKEKAREWYVNGLDFSVTHAPTVIEDFKQVASYIGVEVGDVFYSGFWSQGDGACFTGCYSFATYSAGKIRSYAPNNKKLHVIADALEDVQQKNDYKLTAKIDHRGRYYNSGCMRIEVEHADNKIMDFTDAEDVIVNTLRELADWLYKQLEKEYLHQVSDEAVAETIEANGYEFYETGERFKG